MWTLAQVRVWTLEVSGARAGAGMHIGLEKDIGMQIGLDVDMDVHVDLDMGMHIDMNMDSDSEEPLGCRLPSQAAGESLERKQSSQPSWDSLECRPLSPSAEGTLGCCQALDGALQCRPHCWPNRPVEEAGHCRLPGRPVGGAPQGP